MRTPAKMKVTQTVPIADELNIIFRESHSALSLRYQASEETWKRTLMTLTLESQYKNAKISGNLLDHSEVDYLEMINSICNLSLICNTCN